MYEGGVGDILMGTGYSVVLEADEVIGDSEGGHYVVGFFDVVFGLLLVVGAGVCGNWGSSL